VNEHEQLGFETLSESKVALDTCALDQVTKLAASYGRTCALRSDGTVACWGTGWGWKNHSAVPATVAGLTDVVDIEGDEKGICALTRDGAVTCWPQWYDPIAVPPVPVTQMSNGGLGPCGVAKDGTVYCGATAVPNVPKGAKVVSGEKYGCVLGLDARITCWGEGTIIEPPLECHGDVCDRRPVDRSPRKAPLEHVINISTERGGVCARTLDGKVRCVDPTSVSSLSETTPVAKEHAWTAPAEYAQVVKGRDHTCGLGSNGLVRCWGDNTFGQLGTGAMGLVPAPAF
jgi:alpha-tubulin suppressor-like RCC1 family protein